MSCSLVAIASAVTALAATGGAVIAWMGLTTWRRQLQKNVDLELGRRTLYAVLEVREAVISFRHPLGYGDPPDAEMGSGQPSSRLSRDHQRRWERLRAKLLELDAALLEAEVAWGEGAVEAVRPIHEVVGELNSALFVYYDIKQAGSLHEAGVTHEESRKARRIIFGYGGDADEFHKKLVSAVQVLESYLRPRIKI